MIPEVEDESTSLRITVWFQGFRRLRLSVKGLKEDRTGGRKGKEDRISEMSCGEEEWMEHEDNTMNTQG